MKDPGVDDKLKKSSSDVYIFDVRPQCCRALCSGSAQLNRPSPAGFARLHHFAGPHGQHPGAKRGHGWPGSCSQKIMSHFVPHIIWPIMDWLSGHVLITILALIGRRTISWKYFVAKHGCPVVCAMATKQQRALISTSTRNLNWIPTAGSLTLGTS